MPLWIQPWMTHPLNHNHVAWKKRHSAHFWIFDKIINIQEFREWADTGKQSGIFETLLHSLHAGSQIAGFTKITLYTKQDFPQDTQLESTSHTFIFCTAYHPWWIDTIKVSPCMKGFLLNSKLIYLIFLWNLGRKTNIGWLHGKNCMWLLTFPVHEPYSPSDTIKSRHNSHIFFKINQMEWDLTHSTELEREAMFASETEMLSHTSAQTCRKRENSVTANLHTMLMMQ